MDYRCSGFPEENWKSGSGISNQDSFASANSSEVVAMKGKLGAAIGILALSFAIASPALAQGQEGAGTGSALRDDLNKAYKLVKLGNNNGSTMVTDQGTVLVVQQAGLLGLPSNAMIPCPAHFKDGTLHGPSMICKAAARNNSKDFPNGDKVYPMKIDVNIQKEEVSMTLLECDTCNNTDPPTYYHAQVIFQFAKGYLESAGSDQVEDTIGKLLATDNSNNNNNADNGNNGNNNGNDQGNSNGNNGNSNANGNGNGNGNDQGNNNNQQQQQQQPVSVQLGQTTDQVIAALGQPDKIITLGTKQIYVYKDLKVTFVNGKVTDAQ
jgi:hypothetical protein